ncbi:hypothetical protein Noc_1111 [Nitrosococcus oceani ATCC 19707]|uniref:Uncharacterized protein n=2 Tax=Nitrosococcus oceani TaxID=1229 RepID=Q3JC31_NITOC|nr:hypothetical protein Noc_1111 [Nitrosococcus oceani ATCC 19707]GEM19254.1 hypothetical protein NONS58_06330 [Nitrosococcus oceani]
MHSTNWMFEIHEFLKDGNYQDRVLPVILKDYVDEGKERKGAGIYAPEAVATYVKFWEDREATLRKPLEGIDISNFMHFSQGCLISSYGSPLPAYFYIFHSYLQSFAYILDGQIPVIDYIH